MESSKKTQVDQKEYFVEVVILLAFTLFLLFFGLPYLFPGPESGSITYQSPGSIPSAVSSPETETSIGLWEGQSTLYPQVTNSEQ